MRATAPLDVDLEDKLIYGLTAARLVYLLIALLSGFALWSSPWADQSIRAAACVLVIGFGAGAAWGRWRGRAADGWIADMVVFAARAYRFSWAVRGSTDSSRQR